MSLSFSQVAYGATSGDGSLSGMAWGAASSAASVIPGGSLVVDLVRSIGSLFGMAPRGDLQKFQRTVYPFMATLAKKSGLSVYCLWFGDAVGVRPDGSYGIADPGINLSKADLIKRISEVFESGRQWYYAACPRPDDDCVNNPSDLLFELHGAAASGGILGGVFESGMFSGKWAIPVLLGAGIVAYLIWGRK